MRGLAVRVRSQMCCACEPITYYMYEHSIHEMRCRDDRAPAALKLPYIRGTRAYTRRTVRTYRSALWSSTASARRRSPRVASVAVRRRRPALALLVAQSRRALAQRLSSAGGPAGGARPPVRRGAEKQLGGRAGALRTAGGRAQQVGDGGASRKWLLGERKDPANRAGG